MPEVVGVVFRVGGKTYTFESGGLELSRGDLVVIETSRGVEVGEVAESPHEISESSVNAPLKPVVRRATSQDLETIAANEVLRKTALENCRRLITKHGLDMKLVDAEVLFGGGKIVFSFYSEERVDFRALVVDLAKALRMRIELRQIGVRDEARILGGLGPCGRHLCCTLFQVDQEPVSIRMAKEQNLPLNPMKISGLCGRLMCCLKFEQDHYVAFRKEAPRRGTPVQTERGRGVVIGYEVPKESFTIKYEDGSIFDEPARECMPVDKLCCSEGHEGGRPCCGGDAGGIAARDSGKAASAGKTPATTSGISTGPGDDGPDVRPIAGAGDRSPDVAGGSADVPSAGGAVPRQEGAATARGDAGTGREGVAGAEGGEASRGEVAGGAAEDGPDREKPKSKKRRGRRRSSRSGRDQEGRPGEEGRPSSGADPSSGGDSMRGKEDGPKADSAQGTPHGSAEGEGDSSPGKKPRRRRRRPRTRPDGGGEGSGGGQGDAAGGGGSE